MRQRKVGGGKYGAPEMLRGTYSVGREGERERDKLGEKGGGR